jgi:hypothetical protein
MPAISLKISVTDAAVASVRTPPATVKGAEVGRRPRSADRRHAQLRLWRARLVDDHDLRLGRLRHPERRLHRRAALPAAERLLGKGAQLVHRDVAGHHQRRIVRYVVLPPERKHVVARHRLDRRLSADLSEAVRMLLAVEHGGLDVGGELRRVVTLLHQLAEPLRALPLDFFRRE